MEQSRKFTVIFGAVADTLTAAWKNVRGSVIDRLNPRLYRMPCAACDGDACTPWCPSEADVVARSIAIGWRFTWRDEACCRLHEAVCPECVAKERASTTSRTLS